MKCSAPETRPAKPLASINSAVEVYMIANYFFPVIRSDFVAAELCETSGCKLGWMAVGGDQCAMLRFILISSHSKDEELTSILPTVFETARNSQVRGVQSQLLTALYAELVSDDAVHRSTTFEPIVKLPRPSLDT